MNELIRKCYKCKSEIDINIDNIKDVVYYKNSFYHKSCFIEKAKKLSERNTKNNVDWKYALEHLDDFENEAQKRLQHFFWRNELNDWILDHYNVFSIPTRFFTTIEELDDGKFKGKRCKPISMQTLCEAWKWGQNNLDKISINNKRNHKGPKDDVQRLMYDLSIIVNKVPNYLAHKSKMQALEATTTHETAKTEINYSNLERKTKVNDFDDISSLLDEIF